MLIEEYLTFLTDVRRLSRNTVRLRETYLRQIAADIDLQTATTALLRTWIAEHREWSAETVNVATATMRSFYGWAREIGRISEDPSRPLRSVPIPQRRPRIAEDTHIEAGIASDDAYVRAATRLGAECGLRVHEIAKLHSDDRGGPWLTVVGKGGKTRLVHVAPELLGELTGLEKSQGTGYYFRSPQRPHLTAEAIRQRITRTLKTNPHSLRHRAGTTVYRGTGNNLRLTQVFLGHSNPQTTANYVHVTHDDLLAASEAARVAA